MIEVIEDPRALGAVTREARAKGQRVGLVPTMGALHAGHISLIEAAAARDDVVVVSVFVNRPQFGEPEDFAAYPRDLPGDVAAAGEAGATVVFAPSEAAMYPGGAPAVTLDPGPLGDILEGASRPGHFRAVATVVAKLFATTGPDAAYFGEKDYQQLLLIHRIASELFFGLEIVDCPTVREGDGLALSSRNRRLRDERDVAPVLYAALTHGRALLEDAASPAEAEAAMEAVVAPSGATLDYAAVRDAVTLLEPGAATRALRLLIAARIGPVRLIDNIAASR